MTDPGPARPAPQEPPEPGAARRCWRLLAATGSAWVDSVNFGLSLAFVTAVFAMIYKWMPRVPVAWRDVWIGAVITALLFTVGKALIGQYIGRSGVASVFGAAAALVVLLLWLYYSAQVFLLGAEFTCAFARRHGSLRAPVAQAAAAATPTRPPAAAA